MSTQPGPFLRPFRTLSSPTPSLISDSQPDLHRSEPEIETLSGDQPGQEFCPLYYEEPEEDVLEVPVFPAPTVPKPAPPQPPEPKDTRAAERRIERILLPFVPISFGS
jgi:hypothetical protein